VQNSMAEATDSRDEERFLDRFTGSALGTFVGDALGEPVEGWPYKAIHSRFGLLDTMIREEGRYTDDTQMMIGILETLRERGAFVPPLCARKFEENFDPLRGYGRRIFGVVERIRGGIPWDEAGTDSFGNGGAMRVAPIGCFYAHDLETLKKNAISSARITHNHPEGIAGAVAQATAVGLALQCGMADETVQAEEFLDTIAGQVEDIDTGFAERLEELKPVYDTFCTRTGDSMSEAIDAITGRYALNLKSVESVPAAIGAFLLSKSFRDAVVLAVNLGGDTDTIGAMAGATSGAYYGFSLIPRNWLDRLENGYKGRDYVIDCVKAIVSSRPRDQGPGRFGSH
jgi:poly(ADP-ribose) glycohydrolase ARH3